MLRRSANIFPLSEELRLKGKTIKTRVISFEIISADQRTAGRLGISSGGGGGIYSFERLRFVDGLPLCLEHSYMPVEPFYGFKYSIFRGVQISLCGEHQTLKDRLQPSDGLRC